MRRRRALLFLEMTGTYVASMVAGGTRWYVVSETAGEAERRGQRHGEEKDPESTQPVLLRRGYDEDRVAPDLSHRQDPVMKNLRGQGRWTQGGASRMGRQ